MARFFRFVEKKRGERRTGSNWVGSLGEAIFCGSLFLLGTLLLLRPAPAERHVLDVPYRNQLDGSRYALANCGPTALSMSLAYYGVDASPWDLRVRSMRTQHSWVDDEGGYSDDYGVFVYNLAMYNMFQNVTISLAPDGAFRAGVDGYEIIGVQSGWKLSSSHNQSAQTAVYLLDKPFKAADGDKLIVSVKSDDIGCVRLSISPLAMPKVPTR